MPVSRNEALAHVTSAGRGAEIWRLLRSNPSEQEKVQLESELDELATAYMNERTEIGKTESDLYDIALSAGVRRSEIVNELFKSVAIKQRRPGESDEMALDRLYEEQPHFFRVVKVLHDAEQKGAARRVKIEKGFREGSEPHRELEARAKQLRKSDPLLSFAQCVDAVLRVDLELSDRVMAQERGD